MDYDYLFPGHLTQNLVVVEKGAARVGRSARDLPNVALTSACVLQPGESATAQRVMDRVGPFAIVALHALWEQSAVTANMPPAMEPLYQGFADYVAQMPTPEDRRYLEVHEGHLIYLSRGKSATVMKT